MKIALTRALNWDEFWHFSQVHSLLDGTLSTPLQTLYTRAFTWVVALPGSSIDHVLIIRMFMFACLITTTFCIVGMAAKFFSKAEALLAGLLYLSAGFVLQHGSSFRFDPMAAMLLSSSLLILLRSNLDATRLIVAAALIALSSLLTIKSGLYLSAFFGVAWLRWAEGSFCRSVFLRLCAVAGLAFGFFGLLYWLHSAGLAGSTTASAEFVVSNAAQRMFSGDGPSTHGVALKAAMLAPVFALCIAMTPFALLRSPVDRDRKILFAGLWLPILIPAFYQNSYPYFYVFILPPVAVACSVALHAIAQRHGVMMIALALTLCGLLAGLMEQRGILERQRSLVAAGEAIFPRPVAYFDFPGMLGNYPKANAFMTNWGSRNYLEGLSPSFRSIMGQKPVPLLIENREMFTNVLSGRPDVHVLPDDAIALRENYIRFWGPFWVAGRELGGGESRTTQIGVPGPYTVVGGPIEIDGRLHPAGAVVELSRDVYRLNSTGIPVQLVWGDHLKRPSTPPPPSPYWTGF
ncbi:hypothetical protein KK137_07915 [Croceibacterium sp. LX-88]|uniref:Glycosyltransferase RgtA/B/C/D-like domain-containing protein n=1 Tax=Croceibacterium selenioxidans TaxID=2838833 RepID=A0ABS5W3C5_9SPHN|nr:hypothetical protein [Croceibacterium selenioxidans]MBT2134253.1 hypothetical protein [Croceibacterium selenioxidans]